MKTILIGLGNPILGDDGVGWRVVEQVEKHLVNCQQAPDINYLAVGGLSLMEHMVGYERAILVDAMTTHTQPVGTVACFPISQLPNRAIGHFSSAHDTTLQNALVVGRSYGAFLPEQIDIVAIEAKQVYDFSESLSEPVRLAIPEAVESVFALLNSNNRRKE